VTLDVADKGRITIRFAEIRYGLPPSGEHLLKARPDTAMASQSGDEMILANAITLPARP
jgi:hypothetical protein